MEKPLIATILLLLLATACSKIVDSNEPSVVTHPDTALYTVTTVEEDNIVYKPRLDKCIIERAPLATGKDSLIAGQINTSPMNIPHLSKDGIGVHTSFNYISFVKKKNNYLYIAESDYTENQGGKIRKIRIP